jgi:pyrroline-5-carboxylate reductase
MALKNRKITFIGAGHITEIIVENLTRTQTASPDQLIMSDLSKERLEILHSKYSIMMAKDNLDAVNRGDFVFINVLPQVVDEVAEELRQATFSADKVVITLAAGIPMKKYNVLGKNLPIVRAMPNPASQIGWGITALVFNAHVTEAQREDVTDLFTSLGKVAVLKEENINAMTALCSPAPIYMFFQALIDGGVRCGIDRETSTKIVYQSIVGAMEVWNRRQVPPDELISEAATPGGTSVESLFTLDKYAFRAAINEAIYNATLKATELGKSL